MTRTTQLLIPMILALELGCPSVTHDAGMDAASDSDVVTSDVAQNDAAAACMQCGPECIDLTSSALHCGNCQMDCTRLPHVVPGVQCRASTCQLRNSCDEGWGDCDGDPLDGCETDFSSDPANCGSCGNVCPTPTGGTAMCAWATCQNPCPPGLGVIGNACVPPLRLIAPLSTARVTSQQPTLRWQLPMGFDPARDGAHVDACTDRACTHVLTSWDAVGTQSTPSMALPSGLAYWRAIALQGGTQVGSMTPTWEFTVPSHPAQGIDTSWGSTFDPDGDGIADYAVAGSGNVYVYFGGTALATYIMDNCAVPGISQFYLDPSASVFGMSASEQFGLSSGGAGDLNGDGYADLLVGAPGTGGAVGQIVAYPGGPQGLGGGMAVAQSIAGPTGAVGFGTTVAALGDEDGDGYADSIVGDSNGTFYLYRGGPAGLATAPERTWTAGFGAQLAAPGDIDGNGSPDIVIGLPSTGLVSLYLNNAGALQPTASSTWTAARGSFTALRGVGDLNADGRADLVVGLETPPVGPQPCPNILCPTGQFCVSNVCVSLPPSEVDVFLGQTSGFGTTPDAVTSLGSPSFGSIIAGTGDVDGDGFDDFVVPGYNGMLFLCRGGTTAPQLGIVAFDLTGTVDSSLYTGEPTVPLWGPGDVNADGFADLVLPGADVDDTALMPAASAGVLFGTSNGTFSAGPGWIVDAPP